MAHESFENEEIAGILNEQFIAIKAEQKPFFAGACFPPTNKIDGWKNSGV